MLNLDTHILVFALDGTLNPRERKVLEQDRWGISAIVLWEVTMLHTRGRIALGLESPQMVKALGRIHVWPLTREVCLSIPALDFEADPADEIIAATSIVHQAPLVTRDARIRRSKLVPLA
jgi:PIN domain nuclease of toxin-antitoxin system